MALIDCPDCGKNVSDSAPACPNCGRPIAKASAPPPPQPVYVAAPKKKGVPGAIVLLVFIALAFWIYNMAHQDEAGSTSGSAQADPPAAPIAMTPRELYLAYDANEVAADQSWAGHPIQITAPIQAIDKDFTNDVVLKFSTGDDFGDLQATLSKGQEGRAASLQRGQVVTVVCTKMHRIIKSPMGSNCTLN